MNKEKILEAGRIASEAKKYAKSVIKKDMLLLEIAEKIEGKIFELGGKPGFPVNLAVNEIAAHYTPSYNDENSAHGLLKVDLGVHVDGWLADTAFSLDLENSEENKKLIEASEKALANALSLVKNREGGQHQNELGLSEIGKTIQETIESYGFSPIINLSGHKMEQHELHAGVNIPNADDKRNVVLEKGLYAIEPFATNGNGKVHDGKPSGIYILTDTKKPRSQAAREILNFIQEEYQTLPFCSRWLVKKFGIKALPALRQLEENKNLHHFPQLVEKQGAKVSQSENTILVSDEVIVTTDYPK